MADGTISYDASQHAAFASELSKIQDNFSDLLQELGNVRSMALEYLEGNAAKSLESSLDDLISNLNTENDNWQTVINNASKVEELLKEADQNSAAAISDSSSTTSSAAGGLGSQSLS